MSAADRLYSGNRTARTCDDPELPEHDKCATNAVGSHLSGIDGYSGVLRTNADTHDEASGKEFLPCSCESGTNWGGSKAQRSNKNFATTTEPVVHWVDDEGATNRIVSRTPETILTDLHSHETCSQENDRVDDADEPILVCNAKLFRERQIGTVRTSLIPSLCGSSNGAESNRVPQHLGAMPFVVTFVYQRSALGFGKLLDLFEVFLIAGNQSSSGEKLCMLRHAVLFGKGAAIGGNLGRREVLNGAQALAEIWILAAVKAKSCITYLQWVLNDVQGDGGATTCCLAEVCLFGVVEGVLLIVGSVVIDFRRKLVRHGEIESLGSLEGWSLSGTSKSGAQPKSVGIVLDIGISTPRYGAPAGHSSFSLLWVSSTEEDDNLTFVAFTTL
jgi:hypothetical protein